MIREAAIRDKDGRVYVGRRHNEIFPLMTEEQIKGSVQGFITYDGFFVTRAEAAKIAFDCGQITEPKDHLFSEDLY